MASKTTTTTNSIKSNKIGLQKGQGISKPDSGKKQVELNHAKEFIEYLAERALCGGFPEDQKDTNNDDKQQEEEEQPCPATKLCDPPVDWTLFCEDGHRVCWFHIVSASTGLVAKFRLYFDSCKCWELREAFSKLNPKEEGPKSENERFKEDAEQDIGKDGLRMYRVRERFTTYMGGSGADAKYLPKMEKITTPELQAVAQREFQWLEDFLQIHILTSWKQRSSTPVVGLNYHGVRFLKVVLKEE